VNRRTLQAAMDEATRFLVKASELKRRWEEDQWSQMNGCRESGAARRASLDLTRALAELRRPS
jgi:hypothetical protein